MGVEWAKKHPFPARNGALVPTRVRCRARGVAGLAQASVSTEIVHADEQDLVIARSRVVMLCGAQVADILDE